MSENRGLATQTREERVSCLSALAQWVDRDGGSARGIRVVKALAEHDLRALASGREPLPCEPSTICSFLSSDGDRIPVDSDPGDVVRNCKPELALESRLPRLKEAWQKTGLIWQPKLVRVQGGGRANPSLYRLDFVPMVHEEATESETATPPDSSVGLSYSSRPAVATWPLRFLFPPQGFALSLRSVRALLYLVLVIALGGTLVILALLAALTLGRDHLRADDYVSLAGFAILGFMVWKTLTMMFSVTTKRLVEFPIMLLATSELHGQIQCMRRRDTKIPTGWISLVRISSFCPICGGTVELAEGGEGFPGRMVGRCTDAPSEHVFSFDPMSHQGEQIRSKAWE